MVFFFGFGAGFFFAFFFLAWTKSGGSYLAAFLGVLGMVTMLGKESRKAGQGQVAVVGIVQ